MTDDAGGPLARVLLTCVSGVKKHSLSRSGVDHPETMLLMGCILENYTVAEIRVWSRAEKSYFTPADAAHTHTHTNKSVHTHTHTVQYTHWCRQNLRKIYRLHV